MTLPKGAVVGRSGAAGNVPGFEYAQRVILAWGNALTSMGERYNESWGRIKSGTFEFNDLMANLAVTYEASFGAVREALKGPDFRPRPEWVHIEYNKTTNTPNTLSLVVTLNKTYNQSVILEDTGYDRLGATGTAGGDLCHSEWAYALRYDCVQLQLDRDRVNNLDPGHYIGFVLAQGMDAEPPLVIVILRVKEDPTAAAAGTATATATAASTVKSGPTAPAQKW